MPCPSGCGGGPTMSLSATGKGTGRGRGVDTARRMSIPIPQLKSPGWFITGAPRCEAGCWGWKQLCCGAARLCIPLNTGMGGTCPCTCSSAAQNQPNLSWGLVSDYHMSLRVLAVMCMVIKAERRGTLGQQLVGCKSLFDMIVGIEVVRWEIWWIWLKCWNDGCIWWRMSQCFGMKAEHTFWTFL